MLISMTGYGAGTATREGITVSVELRGVNNRFFECSARLPKYLQQRENELKDIVRKRAGRGKISLSISVEKEAASAAPVTVNPDAARGAYALLTSLKETVGIESPITPDSLLKFSDVFMTDNEKALSDVEWSATTEALDAALTMFVEMRTNEGRALTDDLRRRVQMMSDAIDKVEAYMQGRADEERAKLRERVAEVLDSEKINPDRLELEIVLLVDKMDITEELVRFRTHVRFFLEMLDSNESEGRKLSFLLQEMNREANTIASKSYDAQTAHLVVSIKEELERVREQIQNVE